MRNRLLLLLVMLGAPRVALACPVCFGQNDSPMAQAMNLGIMLMLVPLLTISDTIGRPLAAPGVASHGDMPIERGR